VQATCHGADNRALVDALRSAGDKARGIATIKPGVGKEEIADMHEAGVRGVRFNFVKRLADPKPDDYYRGLVDLIAEFGWHIVIYFEAADLAERWDLFTSLPTTIVVDHMGRPDVTRPLDDEGFKLFERFLREHENVWAKLSGAERLTKSGPPRYDDVIPFAAHLAAAFPDRVVWGTDWPHPNMKSFMPDEGDQVDLIPRIAPTPESQLKLLVDNPMRLYWEA
ncbi:MAG: amidohydrolase family protein, partial [Trebonia sp.]